MWGYVEVRIGTLCNIKKGTQLNKSLLSGDDIYPVQNGGINPSGYWNEYNYDENHITISQGGASAGYINYMTKKFWAGAHCYVITNNTSICNYKFLYYILKNNEKRLMESQYGAGIPSLSKEDICNINVSLPLKNIQDEIVEKLDTLDTLVNDLTSGIPAEIEARKKQYEYYRDKLLTF